ncbi:hypothetical protein SH467x_000266 [Pirellulaceae bacterium SH467]
MSISTANRIKLKLKDRSTLSRAKTAPGPVVLYCKRNSPQKRELAHSEATGFYATELIKERNCNWTSGRAFLECSLPRQVALRWLWVELSSSRDPSQVKMLFNGNTVLERKIKGRSRLRLRLPKCPPSSRFTIEIFSSTFKPYEILTNSTDRRLLGVLVGEIRVAKYWWRNIDLGHYKYRIARAIQRWRRRTVPSR